MKRRPLNAIGNAIGRSDVAVSDRSSREKIENSFPNPGFRKIPQNLAISRELGEFPREMLRRGFQILLQSDLVFMECPKSDPLAARSNRGTPEFPIAALSDPYRPRTGVELFRSLIPFPGGFLLVQHELELRSFRRNAVEYRADAKASLEYGPSRSAFVCHPTKCPSFVHRKMGIRHPNGDREPSRRKR